MSGWVKLATHIMKTVDILFNLSPPVVVLLLSIIFVRRRLNRELPLFFIYMMYILVATAVRMSVMYRAGAYFWLFWGTEAGFGVFALLVMREVFHRVFALAYASYRSFNFLLPGAVFVILGFTLWETVKRPLGHGHLPWMVSAIYWFDLGVHLLEGVILLLVFALTAAFPVVWRKYEFGILAGFGLNASITMIVYLLRFERGIAYEAFFRYGPPIAYIFATLIWLHAFLRPLAPTRRSQMDMEEMLEVVRRSKELLEKIEKSLGLRRRAMIPPG